MRLAALSLSLCLCLQRDHLKTAQQFFQLVGGSASECGTFRNLLKRAQLQCVFVSACSFLCPLDTIPGRQCMASCFFLLRQFEDVLIYLNSIKVNVPNKVQTRCFLWSHGREKAVNGWKAARSHWRPSLCRLTSITMMPLTSTTLRPKRLSAATKKQKRWWLRPTRETQRADEVS